MRWKLTAVAAVGILLGGTVAAGFVAIISRSQEALSEAQAIEERIIERLQVRDHVLERLVEDYSIDASRAVILAQRVVEVAFAPQPKATASPTPDPLPPVASPPAPPPAPTPPVPTLSPDDPDPDGFIRAVMCDTGLAAALGMPCTQPAMYKLSCALDLGELFKLPCPVGA